MKTKSRLSNNNNVIFTVMISVWQYLTISLTNNFTKIKQDKINLNSPQMSSSV